MIYCGFGFDARGAVDGEWEKQSLLPKDEAFYVDVCERVVQWEVNGCVKVMWWSRYADVGDMNSTYQLVRRQSRLYVRQYLRRGARAQTMELRKVDRLVSCYMLRIGPKLGRG